MTLLRECSDASILDYVANGILCDMDLASRVK
jgi:hypothetical protein